MAPTSPSNLSPWAARFGPLRRPYAVDADGIQHSMLGATHPKLDSRYYHDIDGIDLPGSDPVIPKPKDPELDALFNNERVQQWTLFGPKSRQLGALNTWTFLGKSGHTMYHNDTLGGQPFSVDEATWFDFMRRNRWYKPEAIPHMVPPTHLQELSIDNDMVWGHMRFALELVSRILHLMVLEQHYFLDAVLFGNVIVEEQEATQDRPAQMRLLEPGRSPKLSDGKRIFVMDRPRDQRPKRNDFRDAINALTRNVIWSFIDEDDHRHGWNAWASTHTLNGDMPLDQRGPFLIAISAQFLRGLTEETVTHAEGCKAYWAIASTILHELMHAMWMQRFFCGESLVEPFICKDEMAELGCAAENAIWGGRLRPITGPRFRPDGAFTGNFVNMVVDDWPNPWDVTGYRSIPGSQKRTPRDGVQELVEGAQLFSWQVPAVWVSWLFTQDFWNHAVRIYGTGALQIPKFIAGLSQNWRSSNRAFKLLTIEPMPVVKELQPTLNDVRDRLLKRDETYQNIRPWHLVEHKRWELTPWSWSAAREVINNFTMYHTRREFRQAAESAATLYAASIMAQNRDHLNSGGTLPLAPTYWIFTIIALLMYAALPLASEPGQHVPWDIRLQHPTQHAKNSHPVKSAHMLQGKSHLDCQRVSRHPRRPLTFTANIPGNFLPINSPSDWLVKIDEQFHFWKMRQDPVHNSWLQAAYMTFQEIKTSRASSSSPELWANWHFRIPVYFSDPRWVQWHSQAVGWQVFAGAIDDFSAGFCPSPLVECTPQPPAIIPTPGPMPMTARRKRSPFLRHRYYTIAYVADRIWIVDPNTDDSTVDVYDYEALLHGLEREGDEDEDIVFRGPNGFQLLPNRTELRRQMRDPRMRFKVGKLLQYYRPEEVVEFDGQDGMPSWVAFGGRIFDITEYHSPDLQERQWLKKCAGGPLKADSTEEQAYMKDFLKHLHPFQIGLVVPLPATTPAEKPDYLMTESMLRRYDNPHDGILIAIDGYVYDISSYIDSHPGGARLLEYFAGRDGTKVFLEFHPLSLLETPEFAGLRVAHLVAERERGQIGADEIALHEFVFNVKDLVHEDPPAYDLLAPLCGSEATHVLTSKKDEESGLVDLLTQVYINRRHWIVARFSPEKAIWEVAMDEVKKHKYPTNTGWVVIENKVFDVTPILHYPEYFNTYRNPGLKATHTGTVLRDPALARWLERKHSHRIIAKVAHVRNKSVSSVDLSEISESHKRNGGKLADEEQTRKKRKVNK